MRDKIFDGILYAYYGGLLNKHQHEIMRLYYDCDMSLSEISELLNITRQGVRDIIVRSTAKLIECENKLGFIAKIKTISVSLNETINSYSFNNEQKEALLKIVEGIKEI